MEVGSKSVGRKQNFFFYSLPLFLLNEEEGGAWDTVGEGTPISLILLVFII